MKYELKKWGFSDAEELKNLCNSVNRQYLSNRIPKPYTTNSAAWWLNMVQETEGKKGSFRAVVVDGKIVGSISVEQKEDIYCKTGTIGYMLLDEYWNQGIMSDAVKQIAEIAFQDLDIIRITGKVMDGNDASRRVLEKNDFVYEGTLKSSAFKNGEVKDEHIYRKLKDE